MPNSASGMVDVNFFSRKKNKFENEQQILSGLPDGIFSNQKSLFG
jgi:hypothetical protein